MVEKELLKMKYLCRTIVLLNMFLFTQILIAQSNSLDGSLPKFQNVQDIEYALNYLSDSKNLKDPNVIEWLGSGLEYAQKNGLVQYQVELLLMRSKVFKLQRDYSNVFLDALHAVQLVDENKLDVIWRSRANFLVAFALQEMGAYKEAVEVRKSQLDWSRNHTRKGRYMNHLKAIGGLYYRMNVYDSANVYFKKAYVFAKNHSLREGEASALNNLGLGYYEQGKIDSAQYFFELAFELFDKGKSKTDSIMLGLVGGNLSQCYAINENADIIKELLNSEIQITRKHNYLYTLPAAYKRMAEMYEELGNYENAIAYIDSAFQMVTGYSEKNQPHILHLDVLYYYMELLEKSGKSEEALRLSRIYIKVNEELYGKNATKTLTSSKVSYQVSSMERELDLKKAMVLRLEKEEQFSKLKTGLILAVGFSMVLIALIVILKMRSDQKKKEVIEEYSKQILEKTIENKNQLLTQAMLNLTRKKEFSKELLAKLKKEKTKGGGLDSSIQLFITNEINMDESLFKMDKYISELDESFFTKLELKYPQLSSSDLKLCGLIRMDLSNKELAIIMNITPESMKTRKTRMSKKMQLPPGTKLFEILKNI